MRIKLVTVCVCLQAYKWEIFCYRPQNVLEKKKEMLKTQPINAFLYELHGILYQHVSRGQEEETTMFLRPPGHR